MEILRVDSHGFKHILVNNDKSTCSDFFRDAVARFKYKHNPTTSRAATADPYTYVV